MATICFEIVGDLEVSLHDANTLSEAWEWAWRYIKTEDAGGYDVVSCNAVPFENDFEFTLDRGEDY